MIIRNSYRKQIKDILLELMVQGHIEPGVSMSLPKLSKELGVSVTPIREALTQLTETGMVTYIPNRGFFVAELNQKDAKEIYETISILESEAIKQSHNSKTQIHELKTINDLFNQSMNPLNKLQMDMKFHQKLIENYTNSYVQKLIEDIRMRIIIYEHQFMDLQPIDDSFQMHQQIITALEQNDKLTAIDTLKRNWELSINTIIKTYQSK